MLQPSAPSSGATLCTDAFHWHLSTCSLDVSLVNSIYNTISILSCFFCCCCCCCFFQLFVLHFSPHLPQLFRRMLQHRHEGRFFIFAWTYSLIASLFSQFTHTSVVFCHPRGSSPVSPMSSRLNNVLRANWQTGSVLSLPLTGRMNMNTGGLDTCER